MKEIASAVGFEKWALRNKGSNWYQDEEILKYYGIEQLKRLYPKYFKEVQISNKPQESIIENTVYKKYYQPTPRVYYPTPFDEDFEEVKFETRKEEFQIVKNIFNLDYSFDSSKVKLNIDRLLNEVDGIFSKESTRKDRSYRQILDSTAMGHKLEQYLIDKNNFIDDTRKYMDLLSPQGFSVDCKVVSNWHSGTAEFLVKKLLDRASFSPKTNFIVIYQNVNSIYEYRETIEIF